MLTGGALAAGDDPGALLDGVGDVRLDLLDRLHVDQRPDHRSSNLSATFIAPAVSASRRKYSLNPFTLKRLSLLYTPTIARVNNTHFH
jgi:hypothetical protein